MNIVDEIAAIPLFEGLPKDQHEELAMIAVDNTFKKGWNIFSEGDDGDGFYVVITGRVKIFKLSIEGREQILHIFGPGEPFGEVPVFTGKYFPANAETLEKTRALYFPRTSLVELIARNPSIALNMLAVLSKRLHTFSVLIDDLSLKEVPSRLAAYLLFLSEKMNDSSELELSVTKGQLSSLLGTIPETLSRILTKMTGQDLIQSNGSKITILDREGIEELAEGITRL